MSSTGVILYRNKDRNLPPEESSSRNGDRTEYLQVPVPGNPVVSHVLRPVFRAGLWFVDMPRHHCLDLRFILHRLFKRRGFFGYRDFYRSGFLDRGRRLPLPAGWFYGPERPAVKDIYPFLDLACSIIFLLYEGDLHGP